MRKTIQAGRDGERGFTLVEVTIILVVLVILSMIMLPQLGNFNRLARKVVVFEEVGALCANLKKFIDEVMLSAIYDTPGGGSVTPTDPIGLLVGPGTAPAIGSGATAGTTTNMVTAGNWNISPCPSEDTLSVIADNGTTAVDFDCDRFENHLQVNDPGGNSTTTTDRYKNAIETPTLAGAFAGWRGPYFNTFNADPWGTRYSANVFGLHTDSDGNIYSTAVVCISFGPNQTADTQINMKHPDGYAIGGDDIAAVLSGMGPF